MDIQLTIEKPENNAVLELRQQVTLRGKLTSTTAPVTLYYRWYSSFNIKSKPDKYSIDPEPLLSPETEFISDKLSAMGSHPVILVASDRQTETLDDLKKIGYVLIAGGSTGNLPCVIHVFNANILAPADGEAVPRVNLILQAEAPALWSVPNYQKYNRLSYRWELHPVGLPSERPTFDSRKLNINDPYFGFESPKLELPRITYAVGSVLPETAIGKYEIVLSVLDKDDKEIGKEQSTITVTLT